MAPWLQRQMPWMKPLSVLLAIIIGGLAVLTQVDNVFSAPYEKLEEKLQQGDQENEKKLKEHIDDANETMKELQRDVKTILRLMIQQRDDR